MNLFGRLLLKNWYNNKCVRPTVDTTYAVDASSRATSLLPPFLTGRRWAFFVTLKSDYKLETRSLQAHWYVAHSSQTRLDLNFRMISHWCQHQNCHWKLWKHCARFISVRSHQQCTYIAPEQLYTVSVAFSDMLDADTSWWIIRKMNYSAQSTALLARNLPQASPSRHVAIQDMYLHIDPFGARYTSTGCLTNTERVMTGFPSHLACISHWTTFMLVRRPANVKSFQAFSVLTNCPHLV